MGQEINQSRFSENDHREFGVRLREETKVLKRLFDTRAFDNRPEFTVGLELEGWLIDENYLLSPRNAEFFTALGDPNVCAELSKFNFELGAPPHPLQGSVFSKTLGNVAKTWRACETAASSIGLLPVAIGILPTVHDDMLQLSWMSEGNRYRALNNEILFRRARKPLHIHIEGLETLDYRADHIMLEVACTALQAHLKFNQEDAVRLYNAAILAAAPIVAATANSPFLYGRNLWAETRIPAFEQVTAMEGFHDAKIEMSGGLLLGRVICATPFWSCFWRI